MEQKQQFVSLAGGGRFTVKELCLEFGISRNPKFHLLHLILWGEIQVQGRNQNANHCRLCRPGHQRPNRFLKPRLPERELCEIETLKQGFSELPINHLTL